MLMEKAGMWARNLPPGCPQSDARSLWSRLQPAPALCVHSQGRSLAGWTIGLCPDPHAL